VKAQVDLQKGQQQAQGDQAKTQMDMVMGQQEMSHQREKHQLDMQKTTMGIQAAAAKAALAGQEKNGQRD
jgi:hypothetical protein